MDFVTSKLMRDQKLGCAVVVLSPEMKSKLATHLVSGITIVRKTKQC